MDNNIKEKREIIIRWLREFVRLPTSRFVGLTGWSYDSIKKILEDMETEGLIIRDEETNSSYWRLKYGQEVQNKNS